MPLDQRRVTASLIAILIPEFHANQNRGRVGGIRLGAGEGIHTIGRGGKGHGVLYTEWRREQRPGRECLQKRKQAEASNAA